MPDSRPRSFRNRFLSRLFRRVADSAIFDRRCCFAVAASLLLTGTPLSSQEKPGISVDVKVVNVLATVRDKHGELVSNLGKDDFVLEEDGRSQTITYFSHETDLPLALGLLVDTSGSQRRVIPEERAASRSFLDNMVREGQDKAFIIHFDREVELLQDLTTSHQKLESALDLVEIAQPDDDSLFRRPWPASLAGALPGFAVAPRFTTRFFLLRTKCSRSSRVEKPLSSSPMVLTTEAGKRWNPPPPPRSAPIPSSTPSTLRMNSLTKVWVGLDARAVAMAVGAGAAPAAVP